MKLINSILFLLIISFMLVPDWVVAQNDCDEYKLGLAQKKYEDGNFEQVVELLSPCIQFGFSPKELVQAYKIMASTYFAIDSVRLATVNAAEILKVNPNYEPSLFDLPQFADVINRLKQSGQGVLITSVSKKAENLLQAPATVMVITGEELLDRGYQHLGQVLSDMPGFDIIRGNGPMYCNFYQRGYRSVNNDRTLLLIDGVEENDLVSDNVFMSRQYSLTEIKRIEVIHGPASTMYGANAFVGVINIITKGVDDILDKDKAFGATANVRYGTYNTKIADATLSGRYKGVALTVTGRVFRSDEMDLSGYPEWDFSPKTASDYETILKMTGTTAEKYIAKNNLPVSSDWHTTNYIDGVPTIEATELGRAKAAALDNGELFGQTINGQEVVFNNLSKNQFFKVKLQYKNFTMGYINWLLNEGSMPWYTLSSRLTADDYTRWETKNRSFYVNYSTSITDRLEVTNLVSYKFHEVGSETNYTSYSGYYNKALSFRDLLVDVAPSYSNNYLYRNSNQLREEMRINYTHSKQFDVLAGIEFRNSIIQGNYIKSASPDPDETGVPIDSVTLLRGGNYFRSYDIGFFAQANYTPYSNLKIVSGVRWDYNQIRTHGGFGSVFNPRVAVVYSPNKFVFKAIYATAFKDASYFDKYATTNDRQVNNPKLEPEKVQNIELSAHYEITKGLTTSLVLYDSFYSNVIGTVAVSMADGTKTTQFAAIGKQTIKGGQAELNYAFNKYGRAWFNYTYTNPINDDTGLRISDIAEHSFNIGVSATFFEQLNIILFGNYVGTRKTGAGTYGSSNPADKFDPFFVPHIVVNYRSFVSGLSLQLTCDNIFNKEYFVPGVRGANGVTYASRLPQDGRNITVGLTYNLK